MAAHINDINDNLPHTSAPYLSIFFYNPNPCIETRNNVQEIGFTGKEKIVVAPIGSVLIFSFSVESRVCAVFVFLCRDSGLSAQTTTHLQSSKLDLIIIKIWEQYCE